MVWTNTTSKWKLSRGVKARTCTRRLARWVRNWVCWTPGASSLSTPSPTSSVRPATTLCTAGDPPGDMFSRRSAAIFTSVLAERFLWKFHKMFVCSRRCYRNFLHAAWMHAGQFLWSMESLITARIFKKNYCSLENSGSSISLCFENSIQVAKFLVKVDFAYQL